MEDKVCPCCGRHCPLTNPHCERGAEYARRCADGRPADVDCQHMHHDHAGEHHMHHDHHGHHNHPHD